MNIYIDFKKNKEQYIEELKKRNFNLEINGLGEIFINNINTISSLIAPNDGLVTELKLINNDYTEYNINIKDIQYYEIHNKR